MKLEAEARRHLDLAEAALTGGLPNGIIEFHVPAKAMLGRSRVEIPHIQTAISPGFGSKYSHSRGRSHADYIGDVRWVSISDVPFAVRRLRFENLTP